MRGDAGVLTPPAGVVIPLRSFSGAKERLAPHLSASARSDVARRMAERVVEAAGALTVVIVSGADDVRDWAAARGLTVVDDPGGLDEAAAAGREHVARAGFGRVVVAHGDLPAARSLAPLARDGTRPIAALVPCHRDDGTNVLAVPVDVPFRFAYGPGSFRRHVAEARRLGLGTRVIRAADLAVDVDDADDLAHLDSLAALT
jgi:2-phospho-L-lactate guanylyltransferase